MQKMPVFPVFVLERETGDMWLVRDITQLHLYVEEFWDILDEEFVFWDAEGACVQFPKTFLRSDVGDVEVVSSMDVANRNRYILSYASKQGVSLDGDSLRELIGVFSRK